MVTDITYAGILARKKIHIGDMWSSFTALIKLMQLHSGR